MAMAHKNPYQRNQARRQRNVNAYIDETLFGDGRGGNSRSSRGHRSRSAPAVGGATTISARELFRIQDNSIVLDDAEKMRRRTEKASALQEKMRRGNERKDKMVRMEEERKRAAPVLNEFELLEREKKNKILATAKKLLDEELDDVKDMNQMVAYAQCVTIRDAQIREKEMMQEQLAEANRQQDLAMEVERVKQLRMHQEREKIRAAEQRIGAQVIVKQIQTREAMRLEEQRKREQESAAMLQRQREVEAQEEQKRLEHIEAGKKLLAEVRKANDQQARAKMLARQHELEEEMRIAEYLKQKEAREHALEQEKLRIQEQKDAEFNRQRQMREKANNQAAAMDELRAKRYQEAADRQWRQRQMEIAKKQTMMKEDIANIREKQRRDKAQRLARQVLKEREEYNQTLAWQQHQATIEEAEREKKKAERLAFSRDLKQQILTHDMEKRLAREHFLSEGKEIFKQQEIDKMKLLKIKEEKLQALYATGVPEKYTTELAKKKVLVASIH